MPSLTWLIRSAGTSLANDNLTNSFSNHAESDSSPKTEVVVGIVIGVVTGLTFLMIGGDYIFRNGSDTYGTEKGWKSKIKSMAGVMLKPLACLNDTSTTDTTSASINFVPASSKHRLTK